MANDGARAVRRRAEDGLPAAPVTRTGRSGVGATGRPLVVSVHDVAPSNLVEVRWLLSALDSIGARPRVLKVIPAEDGHADAPLDDALADLLSAEVAAGSEIVLHGFSHRRRGRLRGPWPDRLRGRLFARDSAEFLSLSPTETRVRLAEGRRLLSRVAPVAGFCAPGWLAAPGTSAALRELGFRFLVGFASIRDLRDGRRLLAPAGGYMGSRDEPLIRAETALARGLAATRPLRLFLHPQGARRSRDCARVLRLIEHELRHRSPTTYGALLDA